VNKPSAITSSAPPSKISQPVVQETKSPSDYEKLASKTTRLPPLIPHGKIPEVNNTKNNESDIEKKPPILFPKYKEPINLPIKESSLFGDLNK
jgi:hypothetical protein